MLQNEYPKVIHFCGINFCDLEVKKLHFCGINFCDWQNLEDFAELIFCEFKNNCQYFLRFNDISGCKIVFLWLSSK